MISLTLREQDFACRRWAHHERRIPCQIWKRPFANVPTTSGSPMVNPRARRTSIGSMLNAKFSRPQLKSQAATLPPQRPPTRDWLRRNPLKRQRSPDREKAKPAPHSSMRASSRGRPVTTTPSPAEGAAPLPLCSSKRVEADFQAWRDQRDTSGCRLTGNRRTASRRRPGATIRRHKIRNVPCRERNPAPKAHQAGKEKAATIPSRRRLLTPVVKFQFLSPCSRAQA